jgi:hypothetical protein
VVKAMHALKINKPEWFRDQAFIDWLNSGGTATWHPLGEIPNEYSDIFLVIDGPSSANDEWTGSDDDMPTWDELCSICRQENFRSGIVWITNIEG